MISWLDNSKSYDLKVRLKSAVTPNRLTRIAPPRFSPSAEFTGSAISISYHLVCAIDPDFYSVAMEADF